MEIKQLEYMLKIAEENNITRAAEKLFITQSALNQQLLKLEKELDTQLFIRSRTNWQLTQAGKIYMENAKEIVRIKKDTYNQIFDLVNVKKGILTIGLPPERGSEMFASIYPSFYKKYPMIKVEPMEMNVRAQQYEITNGNLDVGFLTLQNHQKTNDEYITLGTEEIILAVPRSHPLAESGGEIGEILPTISLDRFKEDFFAIMQQGSTLRDIYDELTRPLAFQLRILLETKSCHNLFHMVNEGICCSIIPITYAQKNSNVAYFSLKEKPIWEVCASYKKGRYASVIAREFIAHAKLYWEKKLLL